jgi:hypothetical protein
LREKRPITNPNFKKATDTTAGTASIYGAPDIRYAFDVLDGTHATDRIQSSVIEGLAYNYDVIVYVSGTTIYARRSNGTEVLSGAFGSQDATVIKAAFDVAVTDNKPTVVLIKPNTYTISAKLDLHKDLTIFAYGVTFFCSSGGGGGYNALLATGDGNLGNIRIYGLTLDFNAHAASVSFEGVETSSQQVYDVLLQDCVFKNARSGGALLAIVYTYPDPALPAKKNAGIRVLNCVFDGAAGVAGAGAGTGDLVVFRNTRNLFISGSRFVNLQSTRRAHLMLYGGCSDCVLLGNTFSDNDSAKSDCYMWQCSNIEVVANEIATRISISDCRYINVSGGNRIRTVEIVDNDASTFDAHASFYRATENLKISNNFFNALSITSGDGYTIGTTTEKNIIFNLASNDTNAPKRISITGNHVVTNKMFIDFTGALTSGNPGVIERLYICSNSIVQNSGTNAASATDGGIIRLPGASNWTNGGFKDVFIIANYFSATDQGTLPNDVTLGRTDFSNIVIRENVLSNAGITNTNSYATGITRNVGTSATTRYANSSVVSGSTSPITVTHGLAYTPAAQNIFITPTTAWGSMTGFYTNNYTSTTFDIVMTPAPGQSVSFAWQIARRY